MWSKLAVSNAANYKSSRFAVKDALEKASSELCAVEAEQADSTSSGRPGTPSRAPEIKQQNYSTTSSSTPASQADDSGSEYDSDGDSLMSDAQPAEEYDSEYESSDSEATVVETLEDLQDQEGSIYL